MVYSILCNTYAGYGNTVRHEDLLNQVNYSYNYDMIGRLVGMNSSLGQTLRISYDSKNRTDYVVSIKAGFSYLETSKRSGLFVWIFMD